MKHERSISNDSQTDAMRRFGERITLSRPEGVTVTERGTGPVIWRASDSKAKAKA